MRTCAYKTASGRRKWPNHDPIQELGGINLYQFVENDPINQFDGRGLKKDVDWGDIIDKMTQIIDQGKDIAKEIQDAVEQGKLNNLTPKDALDQFFGLGQLTDQEVAILEAFPDTPSCLKMLQAAANHNQCNCDVFATDCAQDLGVAAGSGSADEALNKLFHAKVCKDK